MRSFWDKTWDRAWDRTWDRPWDKTWDRTRANWDMGQKIILGQNFSIFFCLANLLGTKTWVFLPDPGVQGPKMRVLCHFFRPGPSNEEESGLVQIPSWDIGQTVLSTWANLDLTYGTLARPWGQDREKGHWDRVGPRLGTNIFFQKLPIIARFHEHFLIILPFKSWKKCWDFTQTYPPSQKGIFYSAFG